MDIEGRKPCLCVIQIGDNLSSNSYIRGKKKDCEEVGIEFDLIRLSEFVTQNELECLIKSLNRNTVIDGIILQLPVPNYIDVKKIQRLIAPEKDVDGFSPISDFEPCTPLGVINYLKYNNFIFTGMPAAVIGRSDNVGRPLARMLTDLDATVTLFHSRSNITCDVLQKYDIIFTCIDKIEFFDEKMFSPTQTIIDIGLGPNAEGKLMGNIMGSAADIMRGWSEKTGNVFISGTGGVGLLTRLELLNNTYKAMVGKE